MTSVEEPTLNPSNLSALTSKTAAANLSTLRKKLTDNIVRLLPKNKAENYVLTKSLVMNISYI